jgi:hypothetical protein
MTIMIKAQPVPIREQNGVFLAGQSRVPIDTVIRYYYLLRRQQESEAIRQENEKRFPPQGIRAKLVARLEEHADYLCNRRLWA